MSGCLAGRVALVTGAGRGIGRATALRLAREAAVVVVNDRDRTPAEETVAAIVRAGGRGVVMPVSILDYDGCRAAIQEVVRENGPVDVLISNAGVASSGRPVTCTPLAEARALIELNATAALNLCHLVLPNMRQRHWGRIVLISSLALDTMSSHGAPYNMAKAAAEALVMTVANEERRHGIDAQIVRPGLVDTRLAHEVLGRLREADRAAPPAIAPSEVADAVLRCIDSPGTPSGDIARVGSAASPEGTVTR